MDIGTLIGYVLGGLLIVCAMFFGGQDGLAPFLNVSALLIVFGGSVAALLIAFPLGQVCQAFFAVRKCFLSIQHRESDLAGLIIAFAESVRREGLLAQENRMSEISDPFLAEGLLLVVDGMPPNMVECVLNKEIEALEHRHQQVCQVILYGGRCAPAFGMIGTLIGLVLMLTHLDAETVGPGMAVAVLTTLYGIITAHLVFLPIAEKLKQRHESEMRIKAMCLTGIGAIQAGEHPRMIQIKLSAFLLPNEKFPEQRMPRDETPAVSMDEESGAEDLSRAA